jgi:ADP-ribose pyrophosphatase YjhB (NUDIX family)
MKRDYPERPIVGVGAIILRLRNSTPEVVLVKRGNPPLVGEWTIPGGALELGEPLADGARREALEETSLIVRVTDAVEVFDRILHDDAARVQYHYVLVDYLCVVLAGELRAGGDAVDARWFDSAALAGDGVSALTAEVARRAMQRALAESLLATPASA